MKLVMAQRTFALLCLMVPSLVWAQEPATKPTETSVVQAAAAPDSSGSYVLQARDVLEVRVYNLPELSVTVAIRPDGKVSVPLLNELEAAGRTPAQLADTLTEGYAKEFRNPRVTVIVRSFSNQNVYVGGEVDKPGVIPLTGQITVLQAILQAGGLKETAKEKAVILLRNDGTGKPLVRQLSVNELVHGKPDIVLQPFDVVFVQKSRVARVDKWVDQHIRQMIPISLGMSFSYLLNGQATIF